MEVSRFWSEARIFDVIIVSSNTTESPRISQGSHGRLEVEFEFSKWVDFFAEESFSCNYDNHKTFILRNNMKIVK